MKPVFCPKCHKRVNPPTFLKNVKIADGGGIKLKCADPKCKGIVKYKFPSKEDENI